VEFHAGDDKVVDIAPDDSGIIGSSPSVLAGAPSERTRNTSACADSPVAWMLCRNPTSRLFLALLRVIEPDPVHRNLAVPRN